jgi:hypothetical protein
MLLVLWLPMSIFGCTDKPTDTVPDDKPFLEITPDDKTIEFPSTGGEKVFAVKTNIAEWSAKSENDCCTVTFDSKSFTVYAKPNETEETPLTTTIIVEATGIEPQTIAVIIAGAETPVPPEPNDKNIDVIVYTTSQDESEPDDIIVALPDGTGRKVLFKGTAKLDPSFHFAINTTGDQLLFTPFAEGIYKYDMTTKELKYYMEGIDLSMPTFAPDGKSAYMFDVFGDQLVSLDLESGNSKAVGDYLAIYPACMADGRLVFNLEEWDIAIADADGSNVSTLKAHSVSGDITYYAYTCTIPALNKILYTKISSNSQTTKTSICVMDADGSNEIELYSISGWYSTTGMPSANADGTKITYYVYDDDANTHSLVIADFNGTELSNHTSMVWKYPLLEQAPKAHHFHTIKESIYNALPDFTE